jgi:membrane-bound lytic murein transglycosylase B
MYYMNNPIVRLGAVLAAFAIASVLFWKYKKPDYAAVQTPTPSASLIASPTSTPQPVSPTPHPSATPAKPPIGNARVDYLKEQFAASQTESSVLSTLLADKRLTVYPVKVVAYKDPDWSLIENKLYAPAMLQAGADYIRLNQAVFDKAEQDYGVPKEALAGLIGIETEFGKNAGNYSIFSVLYSRMLRWPESSWKAQASQLAALVKYCAQSHIDCYGVKGSYAGAFGLVQFMPDSLLAYGINGNGDGLIDLSKPADAIPSAANYLKAHGWAVDPLKALARYYGSSEGYPGIVLTYASKLSH